MSLALVRTPLTSCQCREQRREAGPYRQMVRSGRRLDSIDPN